MKLITLYALLIKNKQIEEEMFLKPRKEEGVIESWWVHRNMNKICMLQDMPTPSLKTYIHTECELSCQNKCNAIIH